MSQSRVARHIAVVGLGYVGLPIAVAFGKQAPVIGFDIDKTKIEELRHGIDRTREVSPDDLQASRVTYTAEPSDLKAADFIIVAVPTPIDDALQRIVRFRASGAAERRDRHLVAEIAGDADVHFRNAIHAGQAAREIVGVDVDAGVGDVGALVADVAHAQSEKLAFVVERQLHLGPQPVHRQPLQQRHRVVVASLREEVLDTVLDQQVRDLRGALRAAATARYLQQRAAAHAALRSHGVSVLDVTCEELPGALVERYLAIKREGLL